MKTKNARNLLECVFVGLAAGAVCTSVLAQSELTKPAVPTIELLTEMPAVTPAQESVVQAPAESAPNPASTECSADRIASLLASKDRIGFGANTTGGADASQISVVTSLADNGPGTLREQLSTEQPTWITFDESLYDGTILLESALQIPANVTIDGRGEGRMSGITLSPQPSVEHMILTWSGNVIIHGITLNGNETSGAALMLRTGDNYWIDHVTTTGFAIDDALTIGAGFSDRSTSEVTISNYRVYNTDKGLMIGGEPNFHDTYRPARVTVMKSLFQARDRNPLLGVKGRGHVFNNYVQPAAWSGIDSQHSSVAIAENNLISGLNSRDRSAGIQGAAVASTGLPVGHVFSINNLFTDGADSRGSIDPSGVSKFDIPYAYTLIDPANVEQYVKANAGAENADPDFTVCN